MHTGLLRHVFILILLALAGGLFIPTMAVPRLGLSAHTIGVLSGVLLIALGAVWAQFRLSAGQARLHYWAWLYSSYINWFACLLGGALGAGRTTPLASAGYSGTPLVEGTVTALLVSVAVASFIAVGLSLWGLRPSTGT
jgi:(hydroxyamino)benzene mutase